MDTKQKDLKDYSSEGINKLRKLVGVESNEKIGKECLKYPSIEEEFRANYIKELCVGKRDTPEYRELANVYLDYREGKVKKTIFDAVKEKYRHLL